VERFLQHFIFAFIECHCWFVQVFWGQTVVSFWSISIYMYVILSQRIFYLILRVRVRRLKKECRGGEAFEVDIGQHSGQSRHGVFADSLESPVRAPSVDDSLRLAQRIRCLEHDVAAKSCEIDALRDQARL